MCVIKHATMREWRIQKFFDNKLKNIQQIAPLNGQWISTYKNTTVTN